MHLTTICYSGITNEALKYQCPANLDESTSNFFFKANTPCKPQGSEAIENPIDDLKISPLIVNNPWITMTRGSSSKKLRNSESNAPPHDVQSSPLLKKKSKIDDKPAEIVSQCEQEDQQKLALPVRTFKIICFIHHDI